MKQTEKRRPIGPAMAYLRGASQLWARAESSALDFTGLAIVLSLVLVAFGAGF